VLEGNEGMREERRKDILFIICSSDTTKRSQIHATRPVRRGGGGKSLHIKQGRAG